MLLSRVLGKDLLQIFGFKGFICKIFRNKDLETVGPGGDARRSTNYSNWKRARECSAPFF